MSNLAFGQAWLYGQLVDRDTSWRLASGKGAGKLGKRETVGKVLVLGDDTRSFLAIVRSLGRQGITVQVAPSNFRSPALRSRYIGAVHELPPWMGEDGQWLSAISGLLRAERYDLVIPCDETALLPLHRYRKTLSQFAHLAIPDDRAIGVLFDKHETRELARRVGVRVAVGRLAGPGDTAACLLSELGAPIALKPRRSYSLEKLATRGKVHVLDQPSRIDHLLCESGPGEIVVEQYFAGKGVGISVLANRGRVLQAFEHHRVREVAGAGFYRRSAPLTPDLVHACELIVATLEFSGIAMFEFKVKADGEWVLLEVNARPWGSMPLAVALGVDFPYRWYRLLTAGEEIAAVAYRPGVYGRNLIPDLQNAKIEADLQQLGRIGTAWYLTKVIMEMRRLLTGKEIHDVLVSDDPEPGYFELHEMAAEAWQKLGNALPGSLMRRRVRARARVTSSLKVAAKPAVLLFICQGNICRSPFAEALLRVRVGEAIVEFGSAGMMPRPGRPTPAYGLEAAAAYGVDLSAHRSIWLTREKAEAASLLVVFDEITRSAVMDRYPDLNAPLLLLGDLIGVQHIADPVDGGIDEFRSVYAQIAKAAAELASLLGITQD